MFSNGIFVGNFTYKEGWKGNTDPETEYSFMFDEFGYFNSQIQNCNYTNGVMKNEKYNETEYANGVSFRKNGIFVLKDYGYIDLSYGSSYGIPYGLKPVFKIICEVSNPIFQVANYKSRIYAAKDWKQIYDTDTLFFNKMKQEAKEAGNSELAKKYEMYENIHKGYLTYKFEKYEIAAWHFENALKFGENDYANLKLNECKKQLMNYYNEKIEYADKYFKDKDYKRATKYYEEALKYNKIVYAENKIKEIENIIEQEFQDLVKQADDNFNNYKFAEAKSFYEKAKNVKDDKEYCQNRIYLINDMKNNGDKYYKISNEFYQKNELDSAIHYYKIVNYFYPNNPNVINSLGWAYIINKQFDKALTIFEKAKSITKTSDQTYIYILGNLAHSYLLTDNIEKAKEIYYANKKKPIGEHLWEDMVVNDFNKFIDLGIKNDFYYEIAKKLKRKKMLKTENK